jgi:hypothetical protein
LLEHIRPLLLVTFYAQELRQNMDKGQYRQISSTLR